MKNSILIFLFLISFNVQASPQTERTLNSKNLSSGEKMLTEFYIRSLIPHDRQDKLQVTADEFRLSCVDGFMKYCSQLSGFSEDGKKIDFTTAKNAYLNYYLDSREERGNLQIIPDTVQEFIKITNYRSWKKETVNSRVKKATRVIYRNQWKGRHISVAETWGDVQGALNLRETEIVLEAKREAGNFDFYVYDIEGRVAEQSEFPAGIRPAPLVCVSCHMSRGNQKTSRFIRRDY